MVACRTPSSVALSCACRSGFSYLCSIALGIFAYAAVPLVDTLTTRWFVRDLDMRSNLIASTIQEPLEDLIKTGSPARILGFFQRLTSDERLYAVGLCLSDSADADRHRHVPDRAALLGAHALHDRRRAPVAHGERRAARRRAPARQRHAGRRRARARARHELHRAPQRGDAALSLLLLRGARASASR